MGEVRNAYLHSFFIKLAAFLVIFFGNSIMSIPLSIMLYVFIGSGPENGGLKTNVYGRININNLFIL